MDLLNQKPGISTFLTHHDGKILKFKLLKLTIH